MDKSIEDTHSFFVAALEFFEFLCFFKPRVFQNLLCSDSIVSVSKNFVNKVFSFFRNVAPMVIL